MASTVWILSGVAALVLNSFRVLEDILSFFCLCLRSPAAIAAENLFLRKQLGLYIEGKAKPRRPTDSVRFTLARLSVSHTLWREVTWQRANRVLKKSSPELGMRGFLLDRAHASLSSHQFSSDDPPRLFPFVESFSPSAACRCDIVWTDQHGFLSLIGSLWIPDLGDHVKSCQ